MKNLDQDLLEKINRFDQVVPVFTNVVFDTSQPHANTVFPQMFAWLDTVKGLAAEYPSTLFVIRAHPDETRPGKESQETVEEWAAESGVLQMPNVVYIAPTHYLSSYELILRAKFVMIYNSTIGLEAVILGAPVLCAGRARFTQYPIVFVPHSVEAYVEQAHELLEAADIQVPAVFRENARRFLYYQLYKTSLPFDAFLERSYYTSLVRMRNFESSALYPEHSPAVRAIVNGVLEGGDFLLEENET
jgi:UDP-N-acetylglucosamine 2-epimerase